MTPETCARYMKDVDEFFVWGSERGATAESIEILDELVCDFAHFTFDARGGSGRQRVVNCIYGLNLLRPGTADFLVMAKRCVKGWSRLVPPSPYPPMSWEVALVVAFEMAGRGWHDCATAVLVAPLFYLRVGELLGLRCKDVAFPGDQRIGSDWGRTGLALPVTKTGPNKFAQAPGAFPAFLLRVMVAGKPPDAKVFDLSGSLLRTRFKAICRDLGLSDRYVFHSLRHGAATSAFLRGVPLEEILVLGRWAAMQSARHYVQAGRALFLSVSIPEQVAKAGEAFAKDPVRMLALSRWYRHA